MTDNLLKSLMRLRGVRAAVVATEEDGLVVASSTHVDVNADALAAFGASIVRRARVAGAEIGAGGPVGAALEAEGGSLLAAIREDFLVLVLTSEEAHEGLVRVTAQKVADAFAGQVAR